MEEKELIRIAKALEVGGWDQKQRPLMIAVLTVNEFIYGINDLMKLPHQKGYEKFMHMDKKIKVFIERVFPEKAEKRIKEYNKDVHKEGKLGFAFIGIERSEEDEQSDYLLMLKKAKNLLEAWEDELVRYMNSEDVGKLAEEVKIEKESGWKIKIPQFFEKWRIKKERK